MIMVILDMCLETPKGKVVKPSTFLNPELKCFGLLERLLILYLAIIYLNKIIY